MKADVLYKKLSESLPDRIFFGGSVAEGLEMAIKMATKRGGRPLIYIGGSTFVVSEAVTALVL
jgi:acetylornithine/succinyldiaminopimelate/putrescine aminotransferase